MVRLSLAAVLLVLVLTEALQVPFNLPFFQKAILPKNESLIPISTQQYKDDMVIRLWYENNDNLHRILSDKSLKVWSKNTGKKTIDIQTKEQGFFNLLSTGPLKYKVMIQDLPLAIGETYASTSDFVITEDFHASSEIFFKDYRRFETINDWIELLQQSYPELITIENIGETYEGRPFNVIHLSVPSDDIEHHERKTIVITGGVHAREWISVSSVLYLVYEMINFYEANPWDRKILANLDFLFIPVLNPDGYEYTWDHDRLWRKNRQKTTHSNKECVGIDIDHSYDFHWTHSSDTMCGEEYSGEYPFESHESRIWNEYLNATNAHHKVWGYLDLHLYSQEILTPYAYSCSHLPRDEENLIELAYGIAKAIRVELGKYYDVLPACLDRDSDLIPDLGSGTGLDYMYHNQAFWAFQLKLRDSGSHGFLLPNKYIEPVGREISAGFKYFCEFILNDE